MYQSYIFYVYINVPRKVILNKNYSHCVTHTLTTVRASRYIVLADRKLRSVRKNRLLTRRILSLVIQLVKLESLSSYACTRERNYRRLLSRVSFANEHRFESRYSIPLSNRIIALDAVSVHLQKMLSRATRDSCVIEWLRTFTPLSLLHEKKPNSMERKLNLFRVYIVTRMYM